MLSKLGNFIINDFPTEYVEYVSSIHVTSYTDISQT
jgi:hypothetical protein